MLAASIVSFLTGKIDHLSAAPVYVLVALLVFGEAAVFLGFILPGETSVIIAGVVASEGHVNIVVLCCVVVGAAILGDSVGYEVGKHYGTSLLNLSLLRKRRAPLERALEGLRRRGPLYVFIGRFTAFLRAVMPGLAGMSRLSYRRFLMANAAGAVCWGVGYSLLGYYAGSALSSIEHYSAWGATTLLGVVIIVVLFWHFLRRRRERAKDLSAS